MKTLSFVFVLQCWVSAGCAGRFPGEAIERPAFATSKAMQSSDVPILDLHSKCSGLAILRRGAESEIAADP